MLASQASLALGPHTVKRRRGGSRSVVFRGGVKDVRESVRKFLFFVGHTIDASSRSGVQRVVANLAREIVKIADVDFVKWDPVENQLRYADRTDLERLFRSKTLPKGVSVNRYAHRVRYRFGDTLPVGEPVWLIQPEIFYHLSDGNEIYARVVAQCRDYGIQTAAIFYDLIPITNADYASHRDVHTVYVNRLAQSDLILPISRYAGGTLLDYYTQHSDAAVSAAASIAQRIVPLPLPDRDDDVPHPASAPARQPDKVILSVGTVEPRKQQVQLVQAFQALKDGPLEGWKLVVVGNLHPAVAQTFQSLTRDDPAIDYHGYLSDQEIEALYRQTAFSVFASNDEGFGLPICESVARGVPAVCAGFGSMGEIAEGGGCYTVDVNDQEALVRAIERVATDPDTQSRLDGEIRAREFRTWADYAREFVFHISMRDQTIARERDIATLHATLDGVWSAPAAEAVAMLTLPLASGMVQVCAIDAANPAAAAAVAALDAPPEDWVRVFAFRTPEVEPLKAWPAEAVAVLMTSDACLGPAAALNEALIEAAEAASFDGLLPGLVLGQPDRAVLPARAARGVMDLTVRKAGRREVRVREAMQLALGNATRTAYAATRKHLLSIVISTYNRYPFVRENVRWLLELTAPYRDEVRLVVVDNSSTDDSWRKLTDEFGGRPVDIRRTCSNVGMLGNLRVCTANSETPFTWMIGDDDFITPDTIPAVLEQLRAQPELPFLFVNFGVYYRERFGETDTAPGCIAERILLAPEPSPSGLYTVRHAAAEHDNLFTAIYPIVFRTDLAAACFNFPFTGAPFSNLVECVPTTRMILGTYAEAPAYWVAPVGIIGNAVNSWRHWRVRWHGAMMPEIIALADEAGVDPVKLRPWSMVHWDLFLEAKGLYPDTRFEEEVGPDILACARRMFRRDVAAA